MVGNRRSKILFISHIAKACFKNVSITPGCTVSKTINEYCVDFIKLDTPYGIKDDQNNLIKTIDKCGLKVAIIQLK